MASKSITDDVVTHVEDIPSIEMEKAQEKDHEILSQFTIADQKKIYRRVDYRLVPSLAMLYCISLIDRLNISLATIAGMALDLELTGSRYNVIVLIFFVTYVLFQPASVVILRKVGPRTFLTSICFAWGVLMIGSGFVQKWTDMIAIRLLLGVFEGGLFPACAYMLACWYPRNMLQKRNAAFYMIGTVTAAFAGILAYGLTQMKGLGSGDGLGQSYRTPSHELGHLPGIAGWRWIFIVEGLMTIIVAILALILIVDFPEHSTRAFIWTFLSPAEATQVVAFIDSDRQDTQVPEFNIKAYMANGLDIKLWGFGLLFLCCAMQNFAIAYFLPLILQNRLGFSVAASQCLTTPPAIAAALVMGTIGYFSDKKMLRSPGIIACALVALAGLLILRFASNQGVQYFGVFLTSIGSNSNVPAILTWKANNVRGQWKRAFGSAILISCGGIGSVIGTVSFRTQDAPDYHPGLLACMLASAVTVVVSLAFDFHFIRANRSVDRNEKVLEGLEGFKYTL